MPIPRNGLRIKRDEREHGERKSRVGEKIEVENGPTDFSNNGIYCVYIFNDSNIKCTRLSAM